MGKKLGQSVDVKEFVSELSSQYAHLHGCTVSSKINRFFLIDIFNIEFVKCIEKYDHLLI